jgi:hypothetical protein
VKERDLLTKVVLHVIPAGVGLDGFSADNRGRVTCLFRTQFPPQSGRISPVFSAFEARDLSAI